MMGMKKIKRGSNAAGVLAYALKSGDLIGGNMAGDSTKDLVAEFAMSSQLRPDIKKPVWHQSLRLPESESLSHEKWVELGDKYMRKMGFSDSHQRIYVMHDDPKGQHIHIIANRVSVDSKIYLGKNENLLSSKLCRVLEKDFGLTQIKEDPTKIKRSAISNGEKSRAERLDEIPLTVRLQHAIDVASKDKPTFAVFVARLEAKGIDVLPNGKTGQCSGASFAIDGEARSGTDLGHSYKFVQLTKRLDFDKFRDQHIIDELRKKAAADIEEIKGYISPAAAAETETALKPYSGPKRTLDLAFKAQDDGAYTWKKSGTLALVDNGASISVMSKADSAIKASLQLAKEKGWSSVLARGESLEFKRKSWLIGSEIGLKIDGYEPTEADKIELAARLQNKRNRNGENSRVAEIGRREPGGDQNDSRAVSVGAEHGNRPKFGGRGSEDDYRGCLAGERSPRPDAFASHPVPTATTCDTRSSSMADVRGVSNNGGDIRVVRSAAQSLSDLAATARENRGLEPTSGEERPNFTGRDQIAPDHAAKMKEWEKQHAGLGAEKYRITLKPRLEKDTVGRKLYEQNYGNKGNKSQREAAGIAEKFWSPDEVKEAIYQLRAKNAQGYDIYITPISDNKHFILVDDMTNEKYSGLLKAGVEPAVIQKSSAGNKQAIIIIDKQNTPNEQSLANDLLKRINKKFGDPNITGVIHPFRMAGFSNKKAGKNNYLTTVEKSIRRECNLVSAEMQRLRTANSIKLENADKLKKDAVHKAETDKEYNARMSKIDAPRQITEDAVISAYRREFKKRLGLVKSKGWNLDLSKVDFAVTKELLKSGYKPELIEKAIIEASPGLADRHTRAQQYANDAVTNAQREPDVIKHMQERAHERGNGLRM